MAVELPTSLKVGAKTYSIHWSPEEWAEVDEDGKVGHSNHHKLTIHIRYNLNVDQKADTLLHEILHCVMSQGGHLSNYSIVDDLEEHIVLNMSPWLLLVLRDNPDVLDYILEPA